MGGTWLGNHIMSWIVSSDGFAMAVWGNSCLMYGIGGCCAFGDVSMCVGNPWDGMFVNNMRELNVYKSIY